MRKILILAIAAVLLLGLTACGQNDSRYYDAGIEVTKLMGEIAGNPDYLSLIGGDSDVISKRETVSANDYDSPVAVYSLKIKDRDAFLRNISQDSAEIWNRLPKNLQEQVWNRVTVQTYLNMINARAGMTELAFASVATASVRNDLTPEENACYLYVFEKGTPILVTFSYHTASGQFMFLTREQTASLSDLRNALPDLEVTRVER